MVGDLGFNMKNVFLELDMKKEEFERIVEEGIRSIPPKFLEKLENIDVCVEEEPAPFQLEKLKKRKGILLFGLYEGVPQTKRGHYSQVLPDKITIFKNPIEKVAKTKEEIKEKVKEVVWHEIAHHFGMSEKEVREAQKKRNF